MSVEGTVKAVGILSVTGVAIFGGVKILEGQNNLQSENDNLRNSLDLQGTQIAAFSTELARNNLVLPTIDVPSPTPALITETPTATGTMTPIMTATRANTPAVTIRATEVPTSAGTGDELLGPPNARIDHSVLPYGINRTNGEFSAQEARWVARIINGTVESDITLDPSLNIPQRLANARSLAKSEFGLPDITVDLNTLSMGSADRSVFQFEGVGFTMTNTTYAEFIATDARENKSVVQVFETQPPDNFGGFHQIAVNDGTLAAFANNGSALRSGELIYLVKIFPGEDAGGTPRILLVRSACGNYGRIQKPIPQATKGFLPRLISTPTQWIKNLFTPAFNQPTQPPFVPTQIDYPTDVPPQPTNLPQPTEKSGGGDQANTDGSLPGDHGAGQTGGDAGGTR